MPYNPFLLYDIYDISAMDNICVNTRKKRQKNFFTFYSINKASEYKKLNPLPKHHKSYKKVSFLYGCMIKIFPTIKKDIIVKQKNILFYQTLVYTVTHESLPE